MREGVDEPFGALDATVRKQLRDWLRRLHDEVHVTTIFVTHDQEEALEVAEQVAVINGGRIEQTGSPDELYERPANSFVMGFVGPVSRLGDRWVRPHDIEVIEDEDDGAIQALIERVARVGFEVRVRGRPRRRITGSDPRHARSRRSAGAACRPACVASRARGA